MALTKIPGFGIDTSTFALTSANITGNLTAGNANLGNLVTANYFSGNGSLLTGITATILANGNSNVNIPSGNGNVTISAVGNANIAIITGTGVNVTGYLTASGNITGANANLGNAVTGNYFIGSGNNLSNIQGGNVTGQVSNATVAGTVYTNAQPNITSLGTLSNLVVSGNATITGNLTVSGNTTYVNSNVTYIEDPLIELGGGANGAALTSNDGYDRGTLLHYYTSTTVDAFMGWKNANGEFVFASNASLSSNNVTINTLGNIRAGNANLGNIVTANYVTGTLTTNAQPNITSVGTLASLTVTANITSGNANLGNTVTANYFSGNGSLITGISNAANANYSNYAGIVINGTQSNITQVGTLTNLNVSGNITSGNANLGNAVTANYFIGNGSQLTGLSASTATSLVAGNSNVVLTPNANINMGVAGNSNVVIVTGSGVNISGYTTIVGNLVASNGSLGNLVTANYFSGNGSLLTGVSTMSNGNSNITVALNSTVAISAGGTYDVFYVNNTGANVSGTFGVTGTATVNNLLSNGYANITGIIIAANANLGNIANANYFNGTFTSLAGNQPNIQQVGTLNYLNVSNAGSGNGTVTANFVNATYFKGDGSNLTGIGGAGYIFNANSNVAIPSANSNVYVTVGSTSNVVVFSTTGINANGSANFTGNLAVGGNSNLGNVATANYFKGDGSNLTGIGGAGYIFNANSNVAIPAANSNIYFTVGATSNVVMISNLGINANGYANFTGNLAVGGNANITGTANITANTSIGGNLSVTGNITGGNANLGNLVTANYMTGTLTTQNQPNIVSVGTLLNVIISNFANVGGNLFVGNSASNILVANTGVIIATGNITAANANLGNVVTANYTNAVLTTGAQPNITSIGTLGNLIVTNNVSANTITTGSGTNGNLVIDPDGTGNLVITSSTPVVMSNTLTSNGNVAFSGANISLGAVGNVKITGGSTNQYLKTDGTGNLSWGTPSGGGGGGTGLTYTAATSPPGTPNIADQWYNTTTNVLYEYISDGTTGYWVDIQTPTVSSVVYSSGSSSFSLLVQDEGTNLTTTANTLNFVGSGVTATNSGNVVTVTIPGGSGGGSSTTISNGNSNVNIASANGNVTISAVGNSNIVTVTGTGVNVSGYLTSTGNITGANANLGNLISANYITVSGNITSGNANLGNAVTSNYFIGNGYYLTGISGGGGSSLAVQLQGTTLASAASTINFTGGGDSITASSSTVTVNQLSPFLLMGA